MLIANDSPRGSTNIRKLLSHHRRPRVLLVMTLLISALSLGTTPAVAAQAAQQRFVDGVKIPTAAQSPTIAEIEKNHVLVGGTAIAPPWSAQNPKNGKFVGTAIVVGQEVAKALHVKLSVVPATWDTIVAGLQSKRYEMALAGLGITPARLKAITMVTYDSSGACYLVRKSSHITTLADLNKPNITIGVYVGTDWAEKTSGDSMYKAFPQAKINAVIEPPGEVARINDLLIGRIDMTPVDAVTAPAFVHTYPQIAAFPTNCVTHPQYPYTIAVGTPLGDGVFSHFVAAVIKANAATLAKDKAVFEAPKWILGKS